MAEHDGHRQRMRDRAEKTGLKGFQPHEVLELLLAETIPRRNVNPLAHALIDRFGSFSAVLDARKEELMQVSGVGEKTADHLTRQTDYYMYYMRDRWGEKPKLDTRHKAGQYCTTMFGRQQVESMVMVCLDVHRAVIAYETLATGTIDEAPLYTRTVVECALRYHAHSVLLVHNHPSGSVEPSRGDMMVSQQVARALDTVDIQLMDHIVVAGDRYASLEQAGGLGRRKQSVQLYPLDSAADSEDPS